MRSISFLFPRSRAVPWEASNLLPAQLLLSSTNVVPGGKGLSNYASATCLLGSQSRLAPTAGRPSALVKGEIQIRIVFSLELGTKKRQATTIVSPYCCSPQLVPRRNDELRHCGCDTASGVAASPPPVCMIMEGASHHHHHRPQPSSVAAYARWLLLRLRCHPSQPPRPQNE